jgi:hypothetical protein
VPQTLESSGSSEGKGRSGSVGSLFHMLAGTGPVQWRPGGGGEPNSTESAGLFCSGMQNPVGKEIPVE